MPPHIIKWALCLLILLPVTNRLPAAEKLDLDRMQPVPAGETIPVSDFFRPNLLREPKLNPSGTYMAALVTTGEDRHQLMIEELKTQKIETLDALSDNDIYEANWLNDSRLIFGIGLEKRYGIGLFAANVGDLYECYPLLQYVASRLIAVPWQERLRPLVSIHADSLNAGRQDEAAVLNTNVRSGKINNFFRAGMKGGDVKDVEDDNQKHITETHLGPKGGLNAGFLADRDGRLAYGFTAQDGLFSMHQLVDDDWRKCPIDLDEVDVLDCGRTHGEVAVLARRQEGKPRALQFMDAATGRLGDVLVQDKAYDFDGYLYRDPGTHEIVGAVYERNGPQVVWFDEGYRNLQKVLNGFFPGLVVRIMGSDEAGKIFLVTTYSDRQPSIYYSVDMAKRTYGLIEKSAPWIDPGRMQPMNIMKFKTRDGRMLDAYVTLPAGASKTNPPPLVVLPHDFRDFYRAYENYHVRDSWGFDAEVQFLASRGYAVLQPNYRGSAGYEWLFPQENEWDFRKMNDDVTDATKELIAAGTVDGRRVAIMGSQFGGYMALSGAVNEPAVYRCAVAIEGIFDWAKLIQDNKYYQYDDHTYGLMLRKIGNPAKEEAKFEAISPVRHVDQARCPVLVAYEQHPVDYLVQSKELIKQLKKYSVPLEVLAVGDDRYGMSHLKNRVEMYTRIEAFLAKNLTPASPASVAAGSH